mmetsp:Transcript_3410/g.4439  ORF Transcript_3410/g.4439 Transcript_3410/m.4439 type:complete len:95 (+) Transcript_3410:270-554(+)
MFMFMLKVFEETFMLFGVRGFRKTCAEATVFSKAVGSVPKACHTEVSECIKAEHAEHRAAVIESAASAAVGSKASPACEYPPAGYPSHPPATSA